MKEEEGKFSQTDLMLMYDGMMNTQTEEAEGSHVSYLGEGGVRRLSRDGDTWRMRST